MNFRRIIILSALFCLATTVLQAQLPDIASKLLGGGSAGFTEQEAANGIREALQKGINTGVALVSKTDGYFGNPEIKIPFPPEVIKIEKTLNTMGLGNFTEEVVLTMNRAAEEAAKEALPIFTAAIRKMNLNDAIGIVKGPDNAATQYLSKTSTQQLQEAFKPVIQRALNHVNATQAWEAAVNAYNQIPFVSRQETNLTDYVMGKAIDGLFTMIAKEELKIRRDPAGRTTDLLKKVFGKL